MAFCSGYGVCHKGLKSVIIFEFFRDEELQAVVGCGLRIPFISFSITSNGDGTLPKGTGFSQIKQSTPL